MDLPVTVKYEQATTMHGVTVAVRTREVTFISDEQHAKLMAAIKRQQELLRSAFKEASPNSPFPESLKTEGSVYDCVIIDSGGVLFTKDDGTSTIIDRVRDVWVSVVKQSQKGEYLQYFIDRKGSNHVSCSVDSIFQKVKMKDLLEMDVGCIYPAAFGQEYAVHGTRKDPTTLAFWTQVKLFGLEEQFSRFITKHAQCQWLGPIEDSNPPVQKEVAKEKSLLWQIRDIISGKMSS